MNQDLRDQMLYGQFMRKQQLKQECLRQGEENSFLHQKAERLLSLSKVAKELGGDLDLTKVLAKELLALCSYLDELKSGYQGLPESIRESAAGRQMKNSIIMTSGAINRLDEAKDVPAEVLPLVLEEAAFLLEGADGRA